MFLAANWLLRRLESGVQGKGQRSCLKVRCFPAPAFQGTAPPSPKMHLGQPSLSGSSPTHPQSGNGRGEHLVGWEGGTWNAQPGKWSLHPKGCLEKKKTARLQMLASFKCHSLHRGTSNPPLGTRPVQAVVFMTVAWEEGFSFFSLFFEKNYYLKLAGKIAEV